MLHRTFGVGWVMAVAAVAPGPRARAQDLLYTVPADPGSLYGLDAIDDVDGDGVGDWLAADHDAQVVEVRSGRDGALLLFVSPSMSGFYAPAVDVVDDLDGDGLQEVLFGFPGAVDGNGDQVGAFEVVSLGSGAVLQRGFGIVIDENFGAATSGTGDLSGDGVPDLVVGSSFGYARAYSGATGVPLWTYEDCAADLDDLGDLDGDGLADVQLSCAVVSGGSGKLLFAQTATADAVTRVEDFDGDGVTDFATGGYGAVEVFSGVDGSLIFEFPPSGTVVGSFGDALDSAGDVDGDGLGDLVLNQTTPPIADTVLVVSGSPTLASGTALLTFLDPQFLTNQGFGDAVAGLGDVNGDGRGDVAISRDDAVRVYSGLAVQSYCDALPHSAGSVAQIGHTGTPSIGDATFGLNVTAAPPTKPGIFFMGFQPLAIPLFDGILCVGPGSAALVRFLPNVLTDASGAAAYPLDFSSSPLAVGPAAVQPGDVRYFQFWFRDPLGGPAGVNYSDALEVAFGF